MDLRRISIFIRLLFNDRRTKRPMPTDLPARHANHIL
jgi:hypothetical protein